MPQLPRASRRTAVTAGTVAAGAVLAPLLAGCELGAVLPGADGGERGRRPSVDPAADATAVDEGVLDEAAAEVVGALLLVAGLRDRYPRLRAALADLDRTHAAHLEALGSPERAEPGAPPTGGPREAWALLRRHEVRHQRRLADLAVRADSGQLAQLLASMSAGIAQHVVLLPTGPSR